MKSSSRVFLNCMFCGSNSATTKEHIFGRSMSKKFRAQPIITVSKSAHSPVLSKKKAAGSKATHRNAGMRPLDITSKSMCGQCNEAFGKEQKPVID